jgi:glucosamine--fructose-6-phosphate aminotransferase (isomerizing)
VSREADATILTYAGIEMGVAATKTFTAQSALLFALALALGEARGAIDGTYAKRLIAELGEFPRLVARFLRGDHPLDAIAGRYYDAPYFFFLGRHAGYPVCVEGALKLKEISYIPSEAYAAGEMKHGPIALIDEATPVVCVATDGHVHDKVLSNIQETRARGGRVIAIAGDGNEAIQHLVDDVIYVPRAAPLIQAVLAVVPLQLLAYRIALLRGLDVDWWPRRASLLPKRATATTLSFPSRTARLVKHRPRASAPCRLGRADRRTGWPARWKTRPTLATTSSPRR